MFMGQDGFTWWIGVVEDNNDPLLIGRARVRIFGYHPAYVSPVSDTYVDTDNNKVAISDLPWALPILPLNLSNAYGKIGLGQWVFGFFLDGRDAQEPAILGYLPSAYSQPENNFGKYKTPRNFLDLGGEIPEGEYTGGDFTDKSERFEWHTPSNHFIKMTDYSGGLKEFVLSHSTSNLFVRMETDKNGNSVLSLSHPSGTSIQLYKDDIIVKSPRGTYNLIDQLNWISLQTHTTSSGSKRGPRNFTIGTRTNPPAPPPPSGDDGGGCFTPDTYVLMADGTQKKIVDVKVGDFVYNRTQTYINKVRFIEIVKSERHPQIYSPNKYDAPFATIDHPIYIMNEFSAVDPKLTLSLYPWLGRAEKIYDPIIEKNTYDKVYNLWVEGDGTYIVNGYGTSSIIYDGGMLSDFLEKRFFDEEYIRQLYEEYTTAGNTLLHGAFALNYLIGKYDIKILRELFGYAAVAPMNSWKRKLIITYPMKVVGFLLDITSMLHKWRFIK